MRTNFDGLKTVFLSGALVLGLAVVVGAQYAPPAAQQPMEIPTQAQFPPPSQGAPPQGQAQQSDPGAARISFLHGDVSTQHDGSSDWSAATVNTPVVSGDHVSTGQNARAEIQLDHANILRLSERSTANVVSLARNQMQLQIGQGLANYEVFKNNDANVEIETPNVAIHPEAGEGSYRILVNSDGETIVDVRKGSAEISTPQGSTRVQRDQRITIQGNADNAQYQVSGAPGRDDWDRWNGDRDRTIEGAESWRHTNPNYTGSQDLDSYGHWSNVPDYGDVWFPSAESGWAPYRDGRWVYEPYYGWTWVSYEPWGWAPYHYGRWFVYGGNWGWWPGPIYPDYYPVWAPAYVSFFGFGGGGWGVNFGIGFGGYGDVGWLPCGPGDRFFPWYGRGVNRVNEVNVYNIHNNEYRGGMNPLREGSHAYSNVDRASSDERVRAGFSSMKSGDFGRARVPQRQSRIDAGSFRQASMMTGANPVSPSRESFRASDRQPNSNSIPNRSVTNQHFFSGNSRTNGSFQGGNNAGNANRGGNFSNAPGQQNGGRPGMGGFEQSNTGRVNRGPESSQNPGQRGYAQAPSQPSQPSQAIQSSRPGWRAFTPPSGQPGQSTGGRTFENQRGGQAPSNYSQPSQSPRQYQNNPNQAYPSQGNSNNSRGYSGGNGPNRPTLSMQQPVVTPRGGGSNNNRPPSSGSYGGYPSEPSRGGSYSGRPAPSAPNGGNYGGGQGYSRPPGGGSYGGYRSEPSRGGSYSGRPAPSAPSGGSYGGGQGYNRPPSGGGSYGGGGYRGGPSGGNSGGGSRGGPSGSGSHGGNSGGGSSHGNSSGNGHGNH
ncbi:MAG TPA: DUF6600 domain-containing protein [Candidatus Acidoferrales bacterium]|nr:DUF6600 domain-containing protein [Candidatus Acidoferrales bacterium]